MDVRVADSATALEDAFDVRHAVFVDEQDVDEALEYDEHDELEAGTVHFVAYGDENDSDSPNDANDTNRAVPIGAARLRTVSSDTTSDTDINDGVDADIDTDTDTDIGKVERVAVLEPRRGTGVGRALMLAVEERARDQSLAALELHSQTHAAGFYRELGYESYGDEFEEAGIPHVKMRKPLAEPGE